MAELTGVTVGNYFLLESLGCEGMKESYRARPTTRGGFDVVLRIYRPKHPDPTSFQEHFTTEVEKVWQCHHEHIQPLLEFGSGEDLLFNVTEFPCDKTLEQVLEDGEFVNSMRHIAHLITQVCDALEYAHKRNVVHGNIQPSSLLIQSDQNVLLTNFSMKRIYREGEPLVAQVEEGNASYVAPEQVVGILTPASDIYAVGVLLFRLLTGYLPYSGESAGEIALKHTNEAIPSLRQLRPDIPEPVELVVRVALAKSPEARFPSANALAEALCDAIEPGGPSIISVKPQRRIEVHSRRRTAFAWSHVLSLIAILLVVFGLIGTFNFFSTLPLYLQNNPSLPFHVNKQGSTVETKQGTKVGENPATSGVSPAPTYTNGGNLMPPLHVKPTVIRSNTPTVSGTVKPVIPLMHNHFCAPGTLKLDSSENLLQVLQQVDAVYLNSCHEAMISLHVEDSRTSFNKLEHDRIDIAGSDFAAKPTLNLTDHAIGAMLYALIVSPDVGVNGLSTAEIQEIFDGQISNWGQIGGSNEAITVVLPPSKSSINEIFRTLVLNNGAEDVDAIRINTDLPGIVAQTVLQTPGAISFVPLVIAQEYDLKMLAIDGVEPSTQTLLDGTYAFWSVEHLYTNNDRTAAVQAYEQFIKNVQEEQVLLEFGVVPMKMIDPDVVSEHGFGPVL